MIVEVVILALIAAYAGFVIRKKVINMKNGKFCSCGCDSCPSGSQCKCHKE